MELEVAERAPEHVFVHAGVVRFGRRALVLPGRSLAGKSTLVRELVRRGGIYYSDEYAALDRAGRVAAYPRDLRLRGGQPIPASQLGWHPRLRPVSVGWVLDCRFGGAGERRPLTPGQAVLAAFEHAVAARSRSAEVMSRLKSAFTGARALRAVRGEAAEAADWILEWLGKEDPSRWPRTAKRAKAVEVAPKLTT